MPFAGSARYTEFARDASVGRGLPQVVQGGILFWVSVVVPCVTRPSESISDAFPVILFRVTPIALAS
jgi:hypothetical protein